MIRCVVQVCLDCHLLARFVSDFAATMALIEVVEDGAPSLGIAFFIRKTANGARNHAVDNSLIVVGVCPPGPCAIPGHSGGIVRPSDSARNDAAWNSQWTKESLKNKFTVVA